MQLQGPLSVSYTHLISTEQAERAVPSRTVMASRVARDDVNRSERVQKKENNICLLYTSRCV